MSQFGDFLNDISYGKKFLLNDSNEGAYIPFVINNMFSRFPDSIYAVDELNRLPDIPKKAHYLFLMNYLRARKRFAKMKKKERHVHFDAIQDHYKYSDQKTEEAIGILTDQQIEDIVNKSGGLRSR
jgi:hypothetical protein